MNSTALLLLCIGVFCCTWTAFAQDEYQVSDASGLGRRFDGIGGLSGGGATSKLLVNYPEPQRSQILDYMFKPNFGASLQILKVEIGGDDQTTDGTESSHMHEEWDENYNRGYEWWLMKEAKQRNPDIKLWGLSWAWPAWIGGGGTDPYANLTKTAIYTTKWIQGAKTVHNLNIDYIGIWNEKACNLDYILELRKQLDNNQLQSVQIVACDDWSWALVDLMSNATVAKALYAYGVHYPGTYIPDDAIATNYAVWSSEDYSTYNDDIGAGCWARILNQNYVNGYMTSTTSWNLITGYYKDLPYENNGLMNAWEPWSGYYEVMNPVWVSAHTTQFTQIGNYYLSHGQGVGLLKYGGSYVSFTNGDKSQLTIVVETFSHDHSICIRPDLPDYNVTAQSVAFVLGGSYAGVTELNLWRTHLDFTDPSKSVVFSNMGKVTVSNNRVTLQLDVDSVFTLTTSGAGQKGDYGAIPASQPFPLPYKDDFQSYQLNEEPYNLVPQIGVWEVYRDDGDSNQYARQVILHQPVVWCNPQVNLQPVAVIGDTIWETVQVNVKIRIPSVNGTNKVFVAFHVLEGGCDVGAATGAFFWLTVKSNDYAVTTDISGQNVVASGTMNSEFSYDQWHSVSVSTVRQARDRLLTASVDGTMVAQHAVPFNHSGFVALGTGGWGYADYDDFEITDANQQPPKSSAAGAHRILGSAIFLITGLHYEYFILGAGILFKLLLRN